MRSAYRIKERSGGLSGQNVTSEIAKLGMTNGSFKVCLNPTNGFTAKGGDSVEFMFSANLGEPLKHLSRIASGGKCPE